MYVCRGEGRGEDGGRGREEVTVLCQPTGGRARLTEGRLDVCVGKRGGWGGGGGEKRSQSCISH